MDLEIEDNGPPQELMPGMTMELNLNDMMGGILPKKTKIGGVTVKEARKILEQEEGQKLIDMDEVYSTAVERAEKEGIIFIDEIDKIAGAGASNGPDVSREGVQRDILPLVEGSTVSTKYGPIKTDYILFIAAGAFHVSKVEDLIPELQGRFPIRVNLHSLTQADFKAILSQPENAVTKQYAALLEVDHVRITLPTTHWTPSLNTPLWPMSWMKTSARGGCIPSWKRFWKTCPYNAGGDFPMVDLTIDAAYVNAHLSPTIAGKDLKRYIV